MERTKEKSSFCKKFIGDRKFYMMVLAVAVPIMIQNGITNFVSLLDNIMIGRIGTEQMSGASIVNQLIFVYRGSRCQWQACEVEGGEQLGC